jgi:Predicted metal-binding protein
VSTPITVYKDPSCGCCTKWIDHLRAHGFAVTARDMDDMDEVKATFGVPGKLQSCHTATLGSYVVEGHVPADVIQKMLKERPKILGLAVPGMPVGSPGMEGGRAQHYDVVAFERNGKTSVYAKR